MTDREKLLAKAQNQIIDWGEATVDVPSPVTLMGILRDFYDKATAVPCPECEMWGGKGEVYVSSIDPINKLPCSTCTDGTVPEWFAVLMEAAPKLRCDGCGDDLRWLARERLEKERGTT